MGHAFYLSLLRLFCHICDLLLFIVDGAELLQVLHTAANRLKSQGWTVSTKKTYQAQLTCYFDFYTKVNLPGVAASPEQIILYTAFMVDVKSFKYSAVKNYLNIVKPLHCANDFDDPIHGLWLIQQALKGAKRELRVAQEAATKSSLVNFYLLGGLYVKTSSRTCLFERHA